MRRWSNTPRHRLGRRNRLLMAVAITPGHPKEDPMFNHHSIAAAALLSAMLATIPVAAGADEARSVTVKAADLNLATDAGRTVLKNRIALAVGAVCEPIYGRTPAEIKAYVSCKKTARASAAPQFDAMVASAQTGGKVAVGRAIAAPAE
jgi:UrcA family protein